MNPIINENYCARLRFELVKRPKVIPCTTRDWWLLHWGKTHCFSQFDMKPVKPFKTESLIWKKVIVWNSCTRWRKQVLRRSSPVDPCTHQHHLLHKVYIHNGQYSSTSEAVCIGWNVAVHIKPWVAGCMAQSVVRALEWRSKVEGSNPVRSTRNVLSFSESKRLCWLAVGVPNPRVCIRMNTKDHVRKLKIL